MIPALALDPQLDLTPFGDSGSRFGFSKKWNHNTSRVGKMSGGGGGGKAEMDG